MARTIVLSELVIKRLDIDYARQCVTAFYSMTDSSGAEWEDGYGIFWATMPNPGQDPRGNPLPLPDNWFILPASYFPTLLALRNDADAALSAKFLV